MPSDGVTDCDDMSNGILPACGCSLMYITHMWLAALQVPVTPGFSVVLHSFAQPSTVIAVWLVINCYALMQRLLLARQAASVSTPVFT